MVFVYYLLQHLSSLEKTSEQKYKLFHFSTLARAILSFSFFHTQPHLFSRTSASSAIPEPVGRDIYRPILFSAAAPAVSFCTCRPCRGLTHGAFPYPTLRRHFVPPHVGLHSLHPYGVPHENHHLLKYGAMPKSYAALRFLPSTLALTSSLATTLRNRRTGPSATSVHSWPSRSSS